MPSFLPPSKVRADHRPDSIRHLGPHNVTALCQCFRVRLSPCRIGAIRLRVCRHDASWRAWLNIDLHNLLGAEGARSDIVAREGAGSEG